MNETHSISNAEWEVMKVIWDKSPIKSADIIQALSHKTDWKPKTVQTLIRRLVDKGVIGYTAEGKTYAYYPKISLEKCVAQVTDNFLSKIYNGSLSHFILNFVENKKLSSDDIAELINILEKHKA